MEREERTAHAGIRAHIGSINSRFFTGINLGPADLTYASCTTSLLQLEMRCDVLDTNVVELQVRLTVEKWRNGWSEFRNGVNSVPAMCMYTPSIFE